MSRSYKKTPVVSAADPLYRKFAKRRANKKARKTDNIPSFMAYKKLYQSVDIHSYTEYCEYRQKPDWMTDNHWEHCFLRK